jgi:hypothetical protein
MPYLGFNFMDAFQVKVAALGNGPRGILRDDPRIGKSQAGGSFNVKPAAKFIFITPDTAHLRTGIAWNQRLFLSEKGHKPAASIINGGALFSPTLELARKLTAKLPFGWVATGRRFNYAYIYLQFNEHYFKERLI